MAIYVIAAQHEVKATGEVGGQRAALRIENK
jgi:hypothetical protein